MCPAFSKNELVINSEYATRLIELIDGSRDSISCLMFDWRWYKNDFACDVALINQALVRAVRRGVVVRLVLNSGVLVDQMTAVGFQVKHWQADKLMHAKMIIIDKFYTVIGSHNLTENAMGRNIEASVIANDSYLAEKCTAFFESKWLSL
jgi:phosphatidylserine/phosphatidylglycerophosphate/cardiolipin synthase-like enzyme